jgi:predicted ATP-grasp superfamily ATP-dependent carboligase
LPKNSQANPGSLLIAAISGLQLAQAARHAGFVPLVADFFADSDTQESAHVCRKLDGNIRDGMRAAPLLSALRDLADRAPSPVLGFVYGAGFEDRPALLARIAKEWRLLGNDADTVARLKHPKSFFSALDRLGIPHPWISSSSPAEGAGWLAKRIGGAGGSHIVPSRVRRDASNVYFQERVEGRAVSALFVGNGRDARVLGFSEQWTAPIPKSPYRYGGAAQPASLPQGVARQMVSAVAAIVRSFDVVGLASADFLVQEGTAALLEINPRPGATLEIFDRGTRPLLAIHLDAIIDGRLPSRTMKFDDAMASAIVYAPCRFSVPPGTKWPAWTQDRPKAAERIDKDRPICTVWAHGRTGAQARRLVEERICKILNGFQSLTGGKQGEQKGRNRRGAREGDAERQRQVGAARQSPDR